MNFNYKFLFWIGLLVLIVPFLGVPQSWKDFTLFVVGFVLVVLGIFHRNQEKIEEYEDEEIFVESEDEDLEETLDLSNKEDGEEYEEEEDVLEENFDADEEELEEEDMEKR